MTNIAAKHIQSKLAIKRRAIQQMSDEVIAIGSHCRFRLLAEAIDETLTDVPVGGVNRDVADPVATLFQQSSETIALLGGVTLFQERIAKKRGAIVIRSDDLFILQKIEREIRVADAHLVIQKVRIGMIANQMACLVPGGQQLAAVGVIHAHTTGEKRRPKIFPRDGFQNSTVGLLPLQNRAEGESWIVHGKGKLRPWRIV